MCHADSILPLPNWAELWTLDVDWLHYLICGFIIYFEQILTGTMELRRRMVTVHYSICGFTECFELFLQATIDYGP